MAATTTEGTGNGSAADILPKVVNGIVKTGNLAKNAVLNVDVSDAAVGTAELIDSSVTVAKMSVFKSSEQTGTGSAQNIAHGLGVAPGLVIVYPTDTSPATAGVYAMTEGSHGSTNVVVTVTTGKKFKVVAFA
jgi:hypothetical protein